MTLPNRYVVGVRLPIHPKRDTDTDGCLTDEHYVHYNALALGGAGLVMVEGVAISPSALNSSNDIGLYKHEHLSQHQTLTNLVHSKTKACVGVQLTCEPETESGSSESAPRSLLDSFNSAVRLAVDAGYDCIALNASLVTEVKRLQDAVAHVRSAMPMKMPLMLYLSKASEFAKSFEGSGVDLFFTVGHPAVFSHADSSQHKESREVLTIAQGEDLVKGGGAELVYLHEAVIQDPYWLRVQLGKINVPYWFPHYQTMGYYSVRKHQGNISLKA